MILCLKAGLAGADVPEPTPRGAMCDGEAVAMVFGEADDKTFEVLASRVWKAQADFEDAVVFEVVMYIANMVEVLGRSEVLCH